MSMTQLAFLRKTNFPTNSQLQDAIRKLGFDLLRRRGIHRTYFSSIDRSE